MGSKMVQWDRLIEESGGIFRMEPSYVRRFYPDAGRLNGSGRYGSSFRKRDNLYVSERWICSTSLAVNPFPIKNEGMSCLAIGKRRISLKKLLQSNPARMLGPRRYKKHGAEFRVLTKLVDGAVARPFLFHSSDRRVRAHPERYPGQRFGKEEATFFLEAPKGPLPYTHMGLYPWVTPKMFRRAIEAGGDYIAELSPYLLQRYEQGCLVPGGIIHRPGTAFALEAQQPSDVYILLEDSSAGRRLSPRERHPGFKTLEEALHEMPFDAQRKDGLLESLRVVPTPTGEANDRGASEDWIWSPGMSRHFSGKRARVKRFYTYRADDPHAVLIWKGSGSFGSHEVQSGDELFVSAEAASAGITVRAERSRPLEMFMIYAGAL